jgi:hypothetical protein
VVEPRSPSGDALQSAHGRARRDRFALLVGLSLVLHLFFTPLVAWLGLASHWFERSDEPPPFEELDAIPLDLIEESAEEEAKGEPSLPEQDPVEMIERLVPAPDAPAASSSASAAPSVSAAPSTTAAPSASLAPTAPAASSAPVPSSAPSARPASSSRAHPDGDAGAPPAPQASAPRKPAGSDAGAKQPKAPRRKIENPVALAGKAGEIVKSNARLQLIVYTERLRGHALGERVAQLLPRLPQWNDFFAPGGVNPVRDFDRLFVAGPSFFHSDQLVVALEYNTSREKVRAAVDMLVQRQGRWLTGTPVPAAIAVADRAERLFILGKEKVVWVVPPKLQREAFKLEGRRIPRSQGDEALVATIREPKKSLWRLGLDIAESVHDAKLRVTPLPRGAVKLELSALDKDAETAQRNAAAVEQSINSLVDVISGLTNMLDRFGFGGLVKGVQLPRVKMQTRGNEIWSELVLSAEQAAFILERAEKQLAQAVAPIAAPQGSKRPR